MGSESDKIGDRVRRRDRWLNTWGRWQLRFFIAAIAGDPRSHMAERPLIARPLSRPL